MQYEPFETREKHIPSASDVYRSYKWSAIKFDTVELQLLPNDKAKNKLLRKSLQSAMVPLTGESKYRCSQKFYTISSRPPNISYSFLKKNGEPAITNGRNPRLATNY